MPKLNVTRRTAMTILGSASMIAISHATSTHAASSLQDFGSQLQTLPEITVYTAQRVITMEDNDPAINAVAVIVAPLLMTQIFFYFTRDAFGLYLPGAPFLLSAVLVLVCIALFLATPRSVSDPAR